MLWLSGPMPPVCANSSTHRSGARRTVLAIRSGTPSTIWRSWGSRRPTRSSRSCRAARGYWTEILAPYLRDRGHYIAANPPLTDTSDEAVKGNAAFAAKVAADPADLGKVESVAFATSG